MRNKKGISHVEMILSFVIFIGFLIFIFAIFRPYSFGKKETYLESSVRSVLDYTNTKVLVLSINASGINDPCFYFNYGLDYGLDKVIVKDRNNNFVQATADIGNRKVYINGGNNFYYVFSNPNFTEDRFNTNECGVSNSIIIGLIRTYEMSSFIKLKELENRYFNEYDNLKKELEIPSSSDFAFSVRDNLGNYLINRTGNPKGRVRINAKDIPIQILYETNDHGKKAGNISYAKLNIMLW